MNDAIIPADVAYKRAGDRARQTYWRWERAGLFPERVRIGPNSIGYRESEINEWIADPEAWQARNRSTV